MVRKVIRRLSAIPVALALVLLPLAVLGVVAGPARAAPAPKPTTVTVAGTGLDEPITVRAAEDPELFAALLSQVSWLSTATGQASGPKAAQLGAKYTVQVLVKNKVTQTYDLYPLATGGPRVYRPAKQPDKRKTPAGWFYGRLTMSETLRASGVPLPEKPDVVTGGVGGGTRVNPSDGVDAGEDLSRFLAELRQLLLLNGAVVVVIALGLAGMSLLVRRRV